MRLLLPHLVILNHDADLMFKDELTALPARKTHENKATKRQEKPPGQDRILRIEEPKPPIGPDRRQKHHGHHGVSPALRPTADATPCKEFGGPGNAGQHAHSEAPPAGPEAHSREKGIANQPPKYVSPQSGNNQCDRKSDQHRMDRMTGKRDARANSVGFPFIVFRHAQPTHLRERSCQLARAATLALSTLLLNACSGELSALDPAGPAAERVATLWWVMLTGAMVILAGVMAVALYALKRSRGAREFSSRRVLIGWGLVFPTIILLALMAFAFLRGEQLLAHGNEEKTLIRVHAQQWAWIFSHPEGVQTSNVLLVPAGEDFTLAITSEDVIHSFWIPRLGGKMDAIPGKENRIRLRADQPGTYHGVCAEYCGIGHAHMPFELRAFLPEDYASALEAASEMVADERPVLKQRRAPAGNIIERWGAYLLDWLGVK